MFLRAGSYQHDDAEVALAISRAPVVDATGVTYAYDETWRITGFLLEDDSSALTTSLRALEAAYAKPLSEICLWVDSSTPTAHRILANQTLGGIRPLGGVEYPVGDGAEYTYFRSYQVTVEARIPTTKANRLLSFRESVRFSGGGPRKVLIETRVGPPQAQTVSQQTAYRASQEGEAVGLYDYPVPAAPLWPAGLMRERSQTERQSPRKIGSAAAGGRESYIEFPVRWSYEFESATPMSGGPNIVW